MVLRFDASTDENRSTSNSDAIGSSNNWRMFCIFVSPYFADSSSSLAQIFFLSSSTSVIIVSNRVFTAQYLRAESLASYEIHSRFKASLTSLGVCPYFARTSGDIGILAMSGFSSRLCPSSDSTNS